MTRSMNAGKLLAIGAALVAVLAVSISIWLDPPAENRARRMDGERLRRLNLTRSGIEAYAAKNRALPASLEALDAERNHIQHESWHDPDSGQPFTYEITGEKSYRLCADFDRKADGQPYMSFSRHNAGRDCFEQTIK
jgi:hypothetical protein